MNSGDRVNEPHTFNVKDLEKEMREEQTRRVMMRKKKIVYTTLCINNIIRMIKNELEKDEKN